MTEIFFDMLLEPLVVGMFILSPIILDFLNSKFRGCGEKKEDDSLSKEANMHIEAYQTKKMVEYYKTVNQGVVSLPAFIEAKKALEDKKYEWH